MSHQQLKILNNKEINLTMGMESIFKMKMRMLKTKNTCKKHKTNKMNKSWFNKNTYSQKMKMGKKDKDKIMLQNQAKRLLIMKKVNK